MTTKAYPEWIDRAAVHHELFRDLWAECDRQRRLQGTAWANSPAQQRLSEKFKQDLWEAARWCEQQQRWFDEFCASRGYRWSDRGFTPSTLRDGLCRGRGGGSGSYPRCFDHNLYFRFNKVPWWPAAIMSFPYCSIEDARLVARGFNCEALPYDWYGRGRVGTSCVLFTPANGYAFERRRQSAA